MKRWMLALLLLLWACGAASAAARPETAESGWVNVRDYGAAGDAAYHHHLGEMRDTWNYWVGHYASLVTATRHVPCAGEGENAGAYEVIPDGQTPRGRQICLSDVRPGQRDYTPAVGDRVMAYTAADPAASSPASDDTAAFAAAIDAGDGRLYLPEGDYQVSQLTAARIQDIRGPGRIWLKEWLGGSLYYLAAGGSQPLVYQNYGWIDETRFHSALWRSMHWVTCLQEVRGWTESGDFSGNISPRMEFAFDKDRDKLNVWLTVQPAVAEEDFPEAVTVCISKLSASYTLKGSKIWRRASGEGVEGGLFDLNWDGTSQELPAEAWKDCGSRVEITLRREDLFRRAGSGEKEAWALHCWSLDNKSLGGKRVEYVCGTARVWIKEEGAEGSLMCDIGCDMRTAWEDRHVAGGYIREACDSGTQLLTRPPRQFWAYTVPDSLFDRYAPFPS